MQCWCTLCMP